MQKNMWILLLLLSLLSVVKADVDTNAPTFKPTTPRAPTVPRSPVAILKKYSYICLSEEDDLCLGVSPGDIDGPEPTLGLQLQVKRRIRNEYKALDYKKTRWDADNSQGRIFLSNFTDLCLGREPGTTRVYLMSCDETLNPTVNQWFVETIPHTDGRESLIRLNGTAMCLTVHECIWSFQTKTCILNPIYPGSVATGSELLPFEAGAGVFLNGCYDIVKEPKRTLHKKAQIFKVELDCNAGCSPDLLDNNICDPACNNAACLFDHDDCEFEGTLPPITPTNFPTMYPTIADNNSRPPTTRTPTVNGTVGQAPENESNDNWMIFLIVVIVLLFMCCCGFCLFVFGKRRNRDKDDQVFGIGATNSNAQPSTSGATAAAMSKARYLASRVGMGGSSGKVLYQNDNLDDYEEIDLRPINGAGNTTTDNQRMTAL